MLLSSRIATFLIRMHCILLSSLWYSFLPFGFLHSSFLKVLINLGWFSSIFNINLKVFRNVLVNFVFIWRAWRSSSVFGTVPLWPNDGSEKDFPALKVFRKADYKNSYNYDRDNQAHQTEGAKQSEIHWLIQAFR